MKRPGTPPPLLFFPGEYEHTLVGIPAPNHLPAPRRKSYAERYPPQLDAPVVVEFVPLPFDDDSIVVDVPIERFTIDQIKAGLDAMRAAGGGKP